MKKMKKFNKRTQILFSEKQFKKLKDTSINKNKSIGFLVREAVDTLFIKEKEDKKNIIDKIVNLNLPVGNWEKMKKEIEQGKYKK